jgi:1-deoxy-D-xylulose-5-phosphate reductoisomerase
VREVIILGSTGSIGTQALEVVSRNPELFRVVGLAAGTNRELAMAQAAAHGVPADRVVFGASDAAQLVRDVSADVVLNGITGSVGLAPTLAALESGATLALANKETLVVAGEIMTQLAREHQVALLPVDSEHSAIFQSLPEDPSTWSDRVNKIILTASGGPFRTRDPQTLALVTPSEACAHPNWSMGRKISVDSATMMNKALEVIEAHHLFGMPPERIEVVIHPQSVIHSMVEFQDRSVVAQLGTPDMRVPIAYGLSWPERIESGAKGLDFSSLGALTFESPDPNRFPGLGLAWQSLDGPLGTTAVLNAANEVAVAAFLDQGLRFDRIHAVNEHTLATVLPSAIGCVDDLMALDGAARRAAQAAVQQWLN